MKPNLSYHAFVIVHLSITFICINSCQVEETVPTNPNIETLTVKDIDGNTYHTVEIGNQIWLKENLKTTTYNNGNPIPNVTDNNSWSNMKTGAYVWYENDIIWKDLYGALYNWYTIVDTNGLCPIGWHVPTDEEWTELTENIGGADSPHGNELKSCWQVKSPLGGNCSTTVHPRWDEDSVEFGTDDYGFSGLPGGARYVSGLFYLLGNYGHWWTSTECTSSFAWTRGLADHKSNVIVITNFREEGFSVRCIKD